MTSASLAFVVLLIGYEFLYVYGQLPTTTSATGTTKPRASLPPRVTRRKLTTTTTPRTTTTATTTVANTISPTGSTSETPNPTSAAGTTKPKASLPPRITRRKLTATTAAPIPTTTATTKAPNPSLLTTKQNGAGLPVATPATALAESNPNTTSEYKINDPMYYTGDMETTIKPNTTTSASTTTISSNSTGASAAPTDSNTSISTTETRIGITPAVSVDNSTSGNGTLFDSLAAQAQEKAKQKLLMWLGTSGGFLGLVILSTLSFFYNNKQDKQDADAQGGDGNNDDMKKNLKKALKKAKKLNQKKNMKQKEKPEQKDPIHLQPVRRRFKLITVMAMANHLGISTSTEVDVLAELLCEIQDELPDSFIEDPTPDGVVSASGNGAAGRAAPSYPEDELVVVDEVNPRAASTGKVLGAFSSLKDKKSGLLKSGLSKQLERSFSDGARGRNIESPVGNFAAGLKGTLSGDFKTGLNMASNDDSDEEQNDNEQEEKTDLSSGLGAGLKGLLIKRLRRHIDSVLSDMETAEEEDEGFGLIARLKIALAKRLKAHLDSVLSGDDGGTGHPDEEGSETTDNENEGGASETGLGGFKNVIAGSLKSRLNGVVTGTSVDGETGNEECGLPGGLKHALSKGLKSGLGRMTSKENDEKNSVFSADLTNAFSKGLKSQLKKQPSDPSAKLDKKGRKTKKEKEKQSTGDPPDDPSLATSQRMRGLLDSAYFGKSEASAVQCTVDDHPAENLKLALKKQFRARLDLALSVSTVPEGWLPAANHSPVIGDVQIETAGPATEAEAELEKSEFSAGLEHAFSQRLQTQMDPAPTEAVDKVESKEDNDSMAGVKLALAAHVKSRLDSAFSESDSSDTSISPTSPFGDKLTAVSNNFFPAKHRAGKLSGPDRLGGLSNTLKTGLVGTILRDSPSNKITGIRSSVKTPIIESHELSELPTAGAVLAHGSNGGEPSQAILRRAVSHNPETRTDPLTASDLVSGLGLHLKNLGEELQQIILVAKYTPDIKVPARKRTISFNEIENAPARPDSPLRKAPHCAELSTSRKN